MRGARERFEVRYVDETRRVYIYEEGLDFRRYSDACLWADVAVQHRGGDWIVWDSVERRKLYDSRDLRAKMRAVGQR